MSGGDWPHLAGRLVADGHVLPVRVYYEDTDFSGVVYHASYLRFMERGRTDFLRLKGLVQGAMAAGGEAGPLSFAVRRIMVDFLRPARMDDLLEVHSRVEELGGASLALDQSVRRGDELLIAARVKIAALGECGRPRRLPASVREALGG